MRAKLCSRGNFVVTWGQGQVEARIDRLSRNLAFIAALMNSGVEFVAVDSPHATRLTLHILAAVAEHEREMIAARTKAALAAAKARGIKLGRNGADRLAPAHPGRSNAARSSARAYAGRIKKRRDVRAVDGSGVDGSRDRDGQRRPLACPERASDGRSRARFEFAASEK